MTYTTGSPLVLTGRPPSAEQLWAWTCRASEFEEVMTNLCELAQRVISDPCNCLACERVRDQGGDQ